MTVFENSVREKLYETTKAVQKENERLLVQYLRRSGD